MFTSYNGIFGLRYNTIHAQIMEVMDYLEDEIDEHTYDELIPLQIRMALEDRRRAG